MRRGAVLLFSLIIMSITVIVTGGLCAYYVHSMNLAKTYADWYASRRTDAMRILKPLTDQIAESIDSFSSESSSTTVALNTQGKSMREVLDELKKTVPASATIEGETYTLVAETEIDTVSSTGVLTIRVLFGGIEVLNTRIELETSATLNTLPVFDYVYFADNNGQLNSAYIIANGEVGSNGDFELQGATVNGYLRYLNNLTLSGSPHAWLRGAYMAKIVAEFKLDDSAQQIIEQARPTNPTSYVENGATKTAEWEGGYEPPYATNPYSNWSKTRPSPLDDPTDQEPSAPPDYFERADTTSKDQPKDKSDYWEERDFD